MKGKNNTYEYLGLVTELGLLVATPIIISVLVGLWIDKKLKTNGIAVIISLIFGIIGGFTGAYKRIIKDDEHKSSS